MAGAGAPFYVPLAWPVAHIAKTTLAPADEKPAKNMAAPLLDLTGHLTAMAAATRNFGLAWLCIFYLPALYGQEYPAFGPGATLSFDWMWPILARNLLATWLICGFWDWFLYFSPLKAKLHKYKLNPVYPSMAQFWHDSFYTTTASTFAACIEITLCHLWATHTLPYSNLSSAPLLHAIVALTTTHWRIPHFHALHRGMHPWKTTRLPDLGKFLYRHVHSLHHKSYNPTAFSGTNMHPVESTLYYTCSLIPVAAGLHPVFALGAIVDAAIGAWLGHDGFQWPGSGDYFHLLHHKHFDCNYGWPGTGLDWLFGTFAGCKEDVAKIWQGKPAGEDNDDTELHPASKAVGKVE